MSEPKPQQEPSMEEILASIRRIISEDGTPEDESGGAPAQAADESAVSEPADEPAEEEVLELTEVVEEEAEASEPADQDVVDAMFAGGATSEAGAEPESEPKPARPQPPPRTAEEGLLSAAVAGAAESQLSSLVAAVDRAQGGTPIGAGNRTIEDLVKEVMRPMIKAWLDAHLPALVERLVRREVERLSRRAEGDE